MQCALVAIRPDEHGDFDALEACARKRLQTYCRPFCMCQGGGALLVVIDASGGGVAQFAMHLQADLAGKDGFLTSAFVSDTHEAPAMLNLCYREVIDLIDLKGESAFSQVVEYASLPGPQEAGNAREAAPDYAALYAYLQANYRDPNLSASSVARAFGMSQSGVSRLFKRHGYDGFLHCLHSLRIARAVELLRDTAQPVSDIAQSVGYGSALTMTRAFKRYTGKTPGAFRNPVDP